VLAAAFRTENEKDEAFFSHIFIPFTQSP